MQTLPAMLLEIPSKKWCNKIDSSKSMAYSGLDFFYIWQTIRLNRKLATRYCDGWRWYYFLRFVKILSWKSREIFWQENPAISFGNPSLQSSRERNSWYFDCKTLQKAKAKRLWEIGFITSDKIFAALKVSSSPNVLSIHDDNLFWLRGFIIGNNPKQREWRALVVF